MMHENVILQQLYIFDGLNILNESSAAAEKQQLLRNRSTLRLQFVEAVCIFLRRSAPNNLQLLYSERLSVTYCTTGRV